MVRLTFAKLALIGAGVATVAGVGAAGATSLGSSSPVASQLAASTSTPPATAPATTHQNKKHAGLALALRHRLVQATAKATGQTVAQVRAELATGKSLNQIAGDKAAVVEKSVGDAIKDRLDKAVAKGRITKEKEADILSRLQPALDKLMAATHTKAVAPASTPKA